MQDSGPALGGDERILFDDLRVEIPSDECHTTYLGPPAPFAPEPQVEAALRQQRPGFLRRNFSPAFEFPSWMSSELAAGMKRRPAKRTSILKLTATALIALCIDSSARAQQEPKTDLQKPQRDQPKWATDGRNVVLPRYSERAQINPKNFQRHFGANFETGDVGHTAGTPCLGATIDMYARQRGHLRKFMACDPIKEKMDWAFKESFPVPSGAGMPDRGDG